MIFERIQTSAEQLTRSEQKLIRELLARPRDVALGTAGELARRIGVHEATVSRLARKLGFENYAHFRDAIRQEFIVKTDPATRVRNTLAATAHGSILGDLVAQEAQALTSITDCVSDAAIEGAAAALEAARKVFIFARGNAEALAVLADRRLRRIGVDTVVLSGDARDLAERLAAMEKPDALIGFAFRRTPRHWSKVVGHAADIGAVAVTISDTLGPSLLPRGDHLLFAPRSGSEEAFQTLLVPMTITNALILQMARSDERRSMERLERVGTLLARFDTR
ncbi:MurR/RpiR family transcriptional regulator [Aureimonas altamirensis]|uniref:MurR/RpiR family transcriptional regulator n=1 Tax=Aureimonas altamirensis TaxID=370622 RepID=UPI0020370D4E|nr:MurR/RpiR family transcriptional regulator [Aureimonas altamirensis]MCM2504911.1 MurR/RpiR family transcriptional regulator [Aureimonas altamirensis]